MNLLELEIDNAARALGLGSDVFTIIHPDIAEGVIRRVEEVFIDGRTAAWWSAIKHVIFRHHYREGDGYRHLLDVAPIRNGLCWFIPEPGQYKSPEDAYFLQVYRAEISVLPDLIGECFGFAYYICEPTFRWLLLETSEDEIMLAWNPADPERVCIEAIKTEPPSASAPG